MDIETIKTLSLCTVFTKYKGKYNMDFGNINYSALHEQHVIFEDSPPLEWSPSTPCLSYKATKWGGGGLHMRPQNQRLCPPGVAR